MRVLVDAPSEESVADLVRRHRMRWHLASEKAVIGGELRAIGLTLTLSAAHDRPARAPSPGCDECAPVIRALERVIEAVLPKEHRRSTYEVTIPTAELEYPPGQQPEISATITVLHQGTGMNEPIDACEVRCAQEIASKLRDLGAVST